MSWFTRSATAGSLLVAFAGSVANAGFSQNIFLTFADPVGQREVTYTQPPNALSSGSISYNTSIPVGLTFDLTDVNVLSGLLITSNLSVDVDVGPASPGGLPNEFVAAANGSYEFRRASDSALLLRGNFTDASLSILRNTSGSLNANGLINGGQFQVTFFPALLAEFANVGYIFAGFDPTRNGDLSFTLTGASPAVTLINPPNSAEQFFSSFNSQAAFSATVPVIPTPGAFSLAFAAGLVVMGIRRR